MNDSKRHHDWLKRAQHDLESAEKLFQDDGHTDTIGYLLHQSVEKTLKGAILFFQERYPKVHDLSKLSGMLAEHAQRFNEHLEDCDWLNDFYIEGRYPIDFVELPDRAEIEKALTIARQIFELALDTVTQT